MSAGRLRHRVRIGAVDLDADRPLDLLELGALERVADPPPDGLGGEELGQHDVGPHPPADLPERRLGHPGHRGQDEREGVRGGIGQLHGEKILGDRSLGNARQSCPSGAPVEPGVPPPRRTPMPPFIVLVLLALLRPARPRLRAVRSRRRLPRRLSGGRPGLRSRTTSRRSCATPGRPSGFGRSTAG